MELTPAEREKIEEALRKAFNPDSFRQMLRLKLGYKLEDEINVNRGFRFIVTDVIEQALDGWLEKLLLAADEYREGNSLALREVVQQFHLKKPEKTQSETVPVVEPAAVAGAESRLEKIVRKRAPFVAFNDFVKKLSDIGPRICRIEYPEGQAQGTGWLVGPDLILTAYHVIENVDKGMNGYAHTDIVCRFDYYDDKPDAVHRTCVLAGDWLVDKSPYSQADLVPNGGEPAKGELDYALIKLAEKMGDEDLANSNKRGWISISESAPVMMENDFVIIPQHPDGRTLELAMGEVIQYNKAASRVQYDTNTEHGSSGSPCFDYNLVPFALHHAAGPAKNLVYNQGVPLREIIKFMKSRNVTAFWDK